MLTEGRQKIEKPAGDNRRDITIIIQQDE